ncbi:MAG: amino acid decarboxylase [Lachnospiraceae bacterium]|nr:amino acid decarboxylase [Lachnospiraceae bacterium]
MDTPILDFVRQYADSDVVRFHMPGHKGRNKLGCEQWDITEVHGADALYEAEGIIARSEENAAVLFGSQRTLYSTEGSSQCIRAMLYLAITNRRAGTAPVVVAARNVHKSFVYAAALLDIEIVWLWPEENDSLCGCPVSAKQLEETLEQMQVCPAAVYLTSPDYLGGLTDIPAIARVCRKFGVLLMVDNAHGAYLKFLKPSLHPLDMGADICCDSAHKTLAVLTGGAYLHIAKGAPVELAEHAKAAMALFGSTSPSYLTLASLDCCNADLAAGYPVRLQKMVEQISCVKSELEEANWKTEESDPLRITLRAPLGMTGTWLAQCLREEGIECEYADNRFLVLMLTPDNDVKELRILLKILGENHAGQAAGKRLPKLCPKQSVSVRQAIFAPHEVVPVEEAVGRICGAPMVSCPPAIPIVVSGECISGEALEWFRFYGVKQVDVLK